MEVTSQGGVSKVKIAVGAASLFLFLVGIKRTFRAEDGREVLSDDDVPQQQPITAGANPK